ncbi:MAG TPA: hypothetical protein VER11_29725 [Polyangiaceae bacterium]|nr:hypothetical protein [Polyangiaceae bacterium]
MTIKQNTITNDDEPRAAPRSSRSDQSILFDTWLRLEPPRWRVRPYVEGFVGPKLLDTRYSLSFPGGSGTASVNDQATASNYGFGAGLEALLARASDNPGSALFVALGFRELYGGHAAFHSRGR